MGLNIVKGNMYRNLLGTDLTHTKNYIKGKCYFDCKYCYMKRWGNQKPPRLDASELNEDLGSGKFIFVGSSIDMLAPDIPSVWIYKIMEHLHCVEDENKFLFQSKNPVRFIDFADVIPHNSILCTTIETNRNMVNISKASDPMLRAEAMRELKDMGYKTMITVEPVLDFDLHDFIMMLQYCKADQINIGADSCGHKLPEPSKEKLQELIKIINPDLKTNIKRLI